MQTIQMGNQIIDWQQQLKEGDFVAYQNTVRKVTSNNVQIEALGLEGNEYVDYDAVSRLNNGELNVDLDRLEEIGGEPYELFNKLLFESSEYDEMNDYNDVLHYFSKNGQNLPPPIL